MMNNWNWVFFLNTWLRACLEVKVTMGDCPCSSRLGNLSMHALALDSELTVMTQNPFDCPLARFSWKRTSTKSTTPMAPMALSTSASVVHCNNVGKHSKKNKKSTTSVWFLTTKPCIVYVFSCLRFLKEATPSATLILCYTLVIIIIIIIIIDYVNSHTSSKISFQFVLGTRHATCWIALINIIFDILCQVSLLYFHCSPLFQSTLFKTCNRFHFLQKSLSLILNQIFHTHAIR